jgi:hypothetical protein
LHCTNINFNFKAKIITILTVDHCTTGAHVSK